MGSLSERRRMMQVLKGIIYPVLIFLIILFAFGLVAPFKSSASISLDASYATEPQSVAQSRLTTTTGASRNEQAQELLLEQLTILRDVLHNIKVGNAHHLSNRDLASAFSGIFSDIGTSLASGASGASMYLGVGIGNGTLSALAVPASMMKTNTAIAPASGINSVAESLGMGLTSSLLGSLNISALLGPTDPGTINAAALSLAQGLGGGAAEGLNLKPMTNGIFNTSGINGIAGNLGQGLSTSFLGGVNVMKVLSSVGGNTSAAQTNEAALSLAQGLGSGAASALKLTSKPADNTSFNTDGLSGIAGNIGLGLSTSALQNLNLSSVMSNLNLASAFSSTNLLDAAGGLGSGLAEGALVGLGLQQDSGVPAVANGTASVGPIVQTFAKGLSESFLANGTITKALKSVTESTSGASSASGLSLSSLNIGKVAQGFAIGLVDGAQSSIENAGGISGVLDMQPVETTGMMAMPTSNTFNDGVGGAATGFGTGLGYEFTKGLLQAFGKPPINSTSPDSSNLTAAQTRRFPAIRMRSVALIGYKRATDAAPTTPAKLDTIMLNTTLDPVIQAGIDALGCQGVGGLAAIGLSLLQRGKISTSSFGNLTSSFASFTNQTYTIKEAGNTYTANIATLNITLNGNPIVKAVVLIVLHVLFAILVYVNAIPAIIMLNSARSFAVMSGRTHLLSKTPKWQLYIGVSAVVPGTILTFIFGVLGEGQRTHFVSAHGIMGLILVILTLAAAALAPLRFKTPTLRLAHKINLFIMMLISAAVVITAFLDISSISICATQFLPQAIFVLIGFLLAIPYLTVLGAVLVEMGLRRWFVGREVVGEIQFGWSGDGKKGFEVEDMKKGLIEGAGSMTGGEHRSISKPISGGRV